MKNLDSNFNEIVQKISKFENVKIIIGKKLRQINNDFKIGPNEEIIDKKIINKIILKNNDNVNAVGIDGGIIKSSYHGLDLILTRAVAVNFIYKNNKIKNVNYFPSPSPIPDPQVILDSLSEIELSSCHNFIRQIKEVETAIESIKKFSPDIVLLDGSVIPHYVTKPDNPFLKEYYKKLVDKYKELFEIVEKQKSILAGIIEDSRGNRFCDILIRRVITILQEEFSKDMILVLERTKDSNLLYYILDRGERTCIFNYSQSPDVHPLIREFKISNDFYSFYLKTVDFDRPVRIDFIASEEVGEIANKISNFLMKTSGHSGYGLPAILIEADQRAKLNQKELELFYFDLIKKIGNISSLFKLRRENRPF